MATKSPREQHTQWPNVADPTELPNVSGASIQDAALEEGDLCYSVSDTMLYFCTTATLGSAVWASGDGGGAPVSSVWLGGGYQYTQAAVPVEEVTGDGAFDGDLVGTATAYFKAMVTNVWAATGTTRVRLYDMGPEAGPPDPTSRLVSELTFTTQGGPYGDEVALTVVAATPSTDDILDSARAYEVAIIQDTSTEGDEAYLGSAGLEAR